MNFFHEDSFLGSIVGPTSDGIDATEKCNIGPHRQQCKQRSMRSIATDVETWRGLSAGRDRERGKTVIFTHRDAIFGRGRESCGLKDRVLNGDACWQLARTAWQIRWNDVRRRRCGLLLRLTLSLLLRIIIIIIIMRDRQYYYFILGSI